jgi:hypothetical protein
MKMNMILKNPYALIFFVVAAAAAVVWASNNFDPVEDIIG